ncbi:zinc finger CCCH domain-containing protein 48 [Tanacetum coccineum]
MPSISSLPLFIVSGDVDRCVTMSGLGDDDNLPFTMRSSSTHVSWLSSHTESVIAAMVVSGIALPVRPDKLYTGSKDEMIRVWDFQDRKMQSHVSTLWRLILRRQKTQNYSKSFAPEVAYSGFHFFGNNTLLCNEARVTNMRRGKFIPEEDKLIINLHSIVLLAKESIPDRCNLKASLNSLKWSTSFVGKLKYKGLLTYPRFFKHSEHQEHPTAMALATSKKGISSDLTIVDLSRGVK